MKTLATFLIIISGIITAVCAKPAKAEPAQVKITVSLRGIDPKWFSSFNEETVSSLLKQDGTVTLPSVTAKSEQPAKIEIIHPYRTDAFAPDAPTIPCGLIFDFKPKWAGENIRLTGSSVFRYSTNKIATGIGSRFIAQENLIDLDMVDGETKSIDLESEGQMTITVTLIDATGKPIKP